jgi:Ca2+-binding RTX toxin-like protein
VTPTPAVRRFWKGNSGALELAASDYFGLVKTLSSGKSSNWRHACVSTSAMFRKRVERVVFRQGRRKVKRVSLLITVVGVAMLMASGVALAATFDGTPGPDIFVGTDRPDDIRGRGGDDTLSGAGGGDRVRGDGGNDTLSGDAGADEVRGNSGNDDMSGGDGADLIRADEGGTDTVSAGAGNDEIDAHDDPGVDTIDCGEGIDTVDFDAGVDVVADNCENRDPH